jgi:hypothetical protein
MRYLAAVLSLAMAAGAASAGVIAVEASYQEVLNGDTSVDLDIVASDDVVLLFSLSRRNSLGPAVTLDWSGGTGDAVTQLVAVSTATNRSNSIYAIELGDIAANETVTFNFASDGRAAGTLVQLSGAALTGVKTVGPPIAFDDGQTTGDLTDVVADSFVLANGYGASGGGAISFAAPAEVVFSQISTGRDVHRSAYDLDVAAGTYTADLTVTNIGGSDQRSLTAVAIAPIPEPSRPRWACWPWAAWY